MITSTANQQVRQVIQLLKKAKCREEQNVFVTEGKKMFLEAPHDRILKIFVSETFCRKEENRRRLPEGRWELVSDAVFSHMSDTKTPQGILCLIQRKEAEAEEILNKKNAFLLIIEDIQDPGNLGTMIRTAEGAGVDGVIMSRNTVDIYNPKVIRSTMGSIYRVPFYYADNMMEVLKKCKERRILCYAAHLKGDKSYTEENYCGKTAFLIGNEGSGLSDILTEQADKMIKIPMKGAVESLNAAMSAGILMYETSRQRREYEQ